jgi:hypothetical protein
MDVSLGVGRRGDGARHTSNIPGVAQSGKVMHPKKHGVEETRDSVSAKLKRGTFPATFLIAALVAIGAEVVKLEDI